jgi:hypothetical protein
MKHISTIINTILAVILILILFTMGLPNFNAQGSRYAGYTDSHC